MSELDQLEMDLLAAADTWFSQGLHLKLQRLVAIARAGEQAEIARQSLLQGRLAPALSELRPATPRFAEPADMKGNGA